MTVLWIIIYSVFFVAIIYTAFSLVHSYRICITSKSWQKTKGVIKQASVKTDQSQRYYFQLSFIYDVACYSYTVNGKDYTGTTTRFSLFRNPLDGKVHNYKPGQAVDVYYNPKKPSQAALELPKQNESFAPALFIIFIACVIGIWFVMKYGYFK